MNIKNVMASVRMKVEEPYQMQVLSPIDGKPIPNAFVKVKSFDAQEVQEGLQNLLRKKAGEAPDGRKISMGEIDLLNCTLAVAEWDLRRFDGSKFISPNGEEITIPCDSNTVQSILEDSGFGWLREQIQTAGSTRRNFFTGV